MTHRKTTCPYCDGPIEYPSHGAGAEIQCPHCQAAFTLPDPGPPIRAIIITLASLIAIGVFATILAVPEAAASFAALLFLLGIIMISVALYCLPLLLAVARKHRNWPGIAIVNIFLGWTLLGWVCSLTWALYRDKGET